MSRISWRYRAWSLAIVLVLAACGGDRTRFYTLLKPETGPAPVAGTTAFAIDVQRVRVPAQVDQPELVVRQGKGELALVETRQWIAPLKDEMRGALAVELGRRLHAQDVSSVAAPHGLPVYQVMVDVKRLDSWLAHSVTLDAVWTVRTVGPGVAPDENRTWTCASSVSTTVKSGYESLVLGAQQNVGRLADDIAALIAAARQAADAATVSCPQAK